MILINSPKGTPLNRLIASQLTYYRLYYLAAAVPLPSAGRRERILFRNHGVFYSYPIYHRQPHSRFHSHHRLERQTFAALNYRRRLGNYRNRRSCAIPLFQPRSSLPVWVTLLPTVKAEPLPRNQRALCTKARRREREIQQLTNT